MLGILNLKLIGISALAGVAVAAYPAYKIHSWRLDSLKATMQAEQKQAVDDATAAAREVCDKNNQIVKEVTYDTQARLNAVRARYYRMLKTAASCQTITAAASGADAATRTDVPVVHVPAMDGIDAARIADEQAARLISLQDFVVKIYQESNQ